MKRILIIMGGFLPGKKYGGPPVSVDNFCSLMKGEAECYILTRNHDMGGDTPYEGIRDGWNDRGNVSVKYVSDDDYNSVSFKSAIVEINPDYLYLQGLFQACVFPCLLLAKRYNVKVILAPRGELCAGAFKKKYKKIPYICSLRVMGLLRDLSFQSTSVEETEAIRKWLGAKSDNIHVLSNIPSTPHGLSQKSFKKKGFGRFVFISRILWKKNLLTAIKYLTSVKGDVNFDIYGPKEDEEYWTRCEAAIKALPSNVNVEYKGVLSHDLIHATFNQYDAFLFPTLSENYGHVIAEALVTGCIPIISDKTPWTDMNEVGAGWALPLDNNEGFVNAIQEVIEMDDDEISKIRSAIATYIENKMNLAQLKQQYLNVFR